jgi:hypothetical protein
MDKKHYFLTKGYPEPILNLPWGVFFVTDYLYNLKRKRPFLDKVRPGGLFVRWCLWNDFWFGMFALIYCLYFVVKTSFSSLPLKRAGAKRALGKIVQTTQSLTLIDEVKKIITRTGSRIVILGHTHLPLHVKLDQGEYLNTGTWNNVTALDITNFGHGCRLIYAVLEYKKNKPQARLHQWYGLHKPFGIVRS